MISIVIPTYNEARNITKLVEHLLKNAAGLVSEIIVSDGGSNDETVEMAAAAGATVLRSSRKGRAGQMNEGAMLSSGKILYFVHADTLPPVTYATDIVKAIEEGFGLGRFITKFDSDMLLLKINAFVTRFDFFICYGGDQTLFMTRDLFDSITGFDVSRLIMEDYDIVSRARPFAGYKIIKEEVLVSARKYKEAGWLKVQLANRKAVSMFKAGDDQQDIVDTYKSMLAK
jgi:rSAM/selenodomain-associated transferase 2